VEWTIDMRLDLTTLRDCYRRGELTPRALIDDLFRAFDQVEDDALWITRLDARGLRAAAQRLQARAAAEGLERMPLYGLPFAVKDNIDVAGWPTTAGCPAFSYAPTRSAHAVEKLLAAGALFVGKTNLDQFATGLVGTRSPHGTPRNPFNADFIPGGSSSGSAVAVARGLVSFSLGTDTAGSGRVPAAFNNIVGLKPTRGLVSAAGVVPACRSLDCVSIFALTVTDAMTVLAIAAGDDPDDPYSRKPPPEFRPTLAAAPPSFVFGVPPPARLRFFGNDAAERLFAEAVERMERMGGRRVEIDYAPFAATAELLYGGPWIAERAAALGNLLDNAPEALHPTTHQIIDGARRFSAVDAFKGLYRLEELRTLTAPVWQSIDFLLLPTAGTVYRRDEVEREPITRNNDLGYYTNFVNLLDLSAIAVPAGFQPNGLPFGVTLVAPAWHDARLAGFAAQFHARSGLTLGATGAAAPSLLLAEIAASGPFLPIAVVGAHLSGEPLNGELVSLGGRLRCMARTAPIYRLYVLPDGKRPGLVREADDAGFAIEVEVWDIPTAAIGSFIAGIAPPLGIGTLTLEDGSEVKGFLCESAATRAAQDISAFGGWRAYRRNREAPHA
jgi:allophanate hydrolase